MLKTEIAKQIYSVYQIIFLPNFLLQKILVLASYYFLYPADLIHLQLHHFQLQSELDFYIQTDGRRNTLFSTDKLSIDPAIGCEINFISKVFLRFGANQFQFFPVGNNQKTWAARPAFGAGFKTRSIQIDYGFNDPGIGNGAYSHIISTLVRFGSK